jgi:hypothetical protein
MRLASAMARNAVAFGWPLNDFEPGEKTRK